MSIGVNFLVIVGKGLMASAERESITGVGRRIPQRGPGAEPLQSGVIGAKPPEAESLI